MWSYLLFASDSQNVPSLPVCEKSGLEYLLRSPAVVYNWASLFLGDINTGTWASTLGESQIRR
jgi:hypothetical protein